MMTVDWDMRRMTDGKRNSMHLLACGTLIGGINGMALWEPGNRLRCSNIPHSIRILMASQKD